MSVRATAFASRHHNFIQAVSSVKIHNQFILLFIVIAIFATTASQAESYRQRVLSDKATFTGSALRFRSSKTVQATPQSAAPAFTVNASLPAGQVGKPYSGSISAVGGVLPYAFSVIAGTLPPGLSLDSTTGQISGTPTVVVTKTFWVRASDAQGNSSKVHAQITIGSSFTTTAVSVTVSPVNASINSGTAQQFSATVQGTSNTAVSWSATAGTISSTGVFTAPAVTSNMNVTVTAHSAADATQIASASVTVIAPVAPTSISVSVSPASASLSAGATQQFTASVQGTTNTAVTWSSSAGIISSNGLFAAPFVTSDTTVRITASSMADASASSSASIIVTAPIPVSSGSGPLCGTDSNGVPTDNSQCGASGTNAYAGENATDLAAWCGGSVPGNCVAVTTCNQPLTSGTASGHSKYYLADNLSCGSSSLALKLARYTDINLNGFTITGVVFSNMGVKGWHLFNGTLNCTVQPASLIATGTYANGCLQDSNNGGIYTLGGGDQIKIHHISGQNSYGCSKFIQLDGEIAAPTGGWTEPAILVYNNTFQSEPITTSCPRQYAGVYSETQPVEYYNNRGDVGATGEANASQLLVAYGPRSNGAFPNYIHNNYLSCETFNVNNSELNGDTCRPILCDGALSCHIQYNDIWPTNNRGIRLRDAFDAEVDHNYFHALVSANGYTGAAIHTGDNDVNSAYGQNLNMSVHDNTIEMGAGSFGVFVRDQQGLTFSNNTYICAPSGCSNAEVAKLSNAPLMGGLAINQTTKVLSCSTCDFYNGGREYKTGSSVTLSGWSNGGNNATFVVAVGPSSTNTTQMVLSDPNNVLVSETGTSSAGAYPTTALTIQSAAFGASLTPEATVMPQATIQQCSSLGISFAGGGTILTGCN